METNGIEGLFIETHNWGKTVAFWQALGYQLELDTGHQSGQLRHPKGGPHIFIAERPASQELRWMPVVGVAEPARFVAPAAGSVTRAFAVQHWGAQEMLLADPDGRPVSVQGPVTDGAGRAEGATRGEP